jgi:hypothetical protein
MAAAGRRAAGRRAAIRRVRPPQPGGGRTMVVWQALTKTARASGSGPAI